MPVPIHSSPPLSSSSSSSSAAQSRAQSPYRFDPSSSFPILERRTTIREHEPTSRLAFSSSASSSSSTLGGSATATAAGTSPARSVSLMRQRNLAPGWDDRTRSDEQGGSRVFLRAAGTQVEQGGAETEEDEALWIALQRQDMRTVRRRIDEFLMVETEEEEQEEQEEEEEEEEEQAEEDEEQEEDELDSEEGFGYCSEDEGPRGLQTAASGNNTRPLAPPTVNANGDRLLTSFWPGLISTRPLNPDSPPNSYSRDPAPTLSPLPFESTPPISLSISLSSSDVLSPDTNEFLRPVREAFPSTDPISQDPSSSTSPSSYLAPGILFTGQQVFVPQHPRAPTSHFRMPPRPVAASTIGSSSGGVGRRSRLDLTSIASPASAASGTHPPPPVSSTHTFYAPIASSSFSLPLPLPPLATDHPAGRLSTPAAGFTWSEGSPFPVTSNSIVADPAQAFREPEENEYTMRTNQQMARERASVERASDDAERERQRIEYDTLLERYRVESAAYEAEMMGQAAAHQERRLRGEDPVNEAPSPVPTLGLLSGIPPAPPTRTTSMRELLASAMSNPNRPSLSPSLPPLPSVIDWYTPTTAGTRASARSAAYTISVPTTSLDLLSSARRRLDEIRRRLTSSWLPPPSSSLETEARTWVLNEVENQLGYVARTHRYYQLRSEPIPFVPSNSWYWEGPESASQQGDVVAAGMMRDELEAIKADVDRVRNALIFNLDAEENRMRETRGSGMRSVGAGPERRSSAPRRRGGMDRLEVDEHWAVKVVIQSYSPESHSLTGLMHALGVPDSSAQVTTFFRGEILRPSIDGLWTKQYGAKRKDDADYWSKLGCFKGMEKDDLLKREKDKEWLKRVTDGWILMRWKEEEFLNVVPAESTLSISGFYFVALDRRTGLLEGLYFDQHSSPYQRLILSPATPSGGPYSLGTFSVR